MKIYDASLENTYFDAAKRNMRYRPKNDKIAQMEGNQM